MESADDALLMREDVLLSRLCEDVLVVMEAVVVRA